MRQGHLRLALVVLGTLAVVTLPSCGFKRKLVSITVVPDTVTIGGSNLNVQFKAVGNYIHPPDSRDITTSVVWGSAAKQVVDINAAGLATSGTVCGANITITATSHSDPHDSSSGVVVGTAIVTVKLPGC